MTWAIITARLILPLLLRLGIWDLRLPAARSCSSSPASSFSSPSLAPVSGQSIVKEVTGRPLSAKCFAHSFGNVSTVRVLEVLICCSWLWKCYASILSCMATMLPTQTNLLMIFDGNGLITSLVLI